MIAPRLFHASEEAGIARFEPRPPPSADAGVVGDCVWAVDEPHLSHYLLPRHCPRICFSDNPAASAEDRRLLGGAGRVVAFEAEWLERVRRCALTLYELPGECFECVDAGAGYWISRRGVTPLAQRLETDLLGALAGQGVEVRVLADFWPLCDAVVTSGLTFSLIRKRNARPRA